MSSITSSPPAGRPPSREPLDVSVSYPAPLIQDVRLGGTPRDYFDANPNPAADRVSCDGGACANLPQEVWGRNPILGADGQPVMQTIHARLQATVASPALSALGWGVAAAAGGAAVGALAGLLLGAPGVGASIGALVLAPLAATAGARSAARDRVGLEWQARPMAETRLAGYTETVEPGRRNGRDGYYHRFHPVLETRPLGAWYSPQIVHRPEEASR